MNREKWLKKNTYNLSGKTVLITGGTGTLAENACLHLLSLNASLILACRNEKKAAATVNRLKSRFPNADISFMTLDLSDLKSNDRFIENYKNLNREVFAFINNAGVFRLPFALSLGGYETHFATNFLGVYYLTDALLSTFAHNNTKVITVTSLTYKNARLNFADPDVKNCKNKIKIYANSKRWLTLSLFDLKKRLLKENSPLSVEIVHPGVSATNIIHYDHGGYSKAFYRLAIAFMKAFFTSPKTASLNLIAPIFYSTDVYEITSPRGLFGIWGYPKITLDSAPNIEEEQEAAKYAKEFINKLKNQDTYG